MGDVTPDIERAAKLAARRDIERDPDAEGIDPDQEWRTQPEEYREAWRTEARWWAEALNAR
jgi:hypothetical protein